MRPADSFAEFVPSCQSQEFLAHLVQLMLPPVLPPVLPLALPAPQQALPQGLLECGQGSCSGSFFVSCVVLQWHLPKHLVDRQLALAERSAPWAAPYRVLRTTQVLDRRANPIGGLHQMEPSMAVGQQEGGQVMARPSAHQEMRHVEGSLRREAAHQGMVRMSWDPLSKL